ncbi:TonB family protein [Caulobacter sp. SLTY]|uniref:TonB family protein n=1 Tax=Caulobacter sp. SLTY TaxID=2683262 RepID=UPI001411C341|nr:TonB family protein [Caulobacter sp. SLTY]NBB13917.1 TonB family protein [Caulobacter sp. SLTY]
MKIVPILTLALLVGTPAMAQRPADIVEAPDWRAKPSGMEVAKAYPASLADRSISGRVKMSCKIGLNGRARDCEILQEGPWGLGFGEAAIRLAERSLFYPGKVNGKPVDGAEMTVSFAFSSPSQGARYVIYQPVFSRAPGFAEMTAAWPEGRDGEDGVAVLRCSLKADGELEACDVVRQSDGGFGKAARNLVDRFQVKLTPEEAKTYARSDVLIGFHFLNPASIEGRTPSVKDPWWITTIDAEKVISVYPAKAAEAGVKSGRGVADCLVAQDGKLTDCKVAREKPENMGFGASAVAIAQLMQMNPWSDKGRPVVGARVKLPIDFNLADEAAK